MIKVKSKHLNLYKSSHLPVILIISGTAFISGCSQHTKTNAPTIASLQATQMVFDDSFDNQASRNNGAWGAVYMSKEELTRPPMNIVDVSSIAKMSDEQIAAVTQYVHSDLNGFTDKVTAANVAQLRHDFPPGADPSE